MMRLKRHGLFGLALLGTLVMISGCFPTVEATETRYDAFPVSGAPTLDISGNDIDVNVTTDSSIGEVQINATVRAWGTSRNDAQRNLENLENLDLSMNQIGDEIRIRHERFLSIQFGINIGSQIKLDILMPDEATLRFSTDDGDVHVGHMTGQFDITTDDGEIELNDVSGSFILTSDDGDITVRNGTGSLNAESDDGNITFYGRLIGPHHTIYADDGDVSLSFPADLNLQIDVSTNDGSFNSTMPFTSEMRHEHHWSATLNAADATLNITTDDGDVTIREIIET